MGRNRLTHEEREKRRALQLKKQNDMKQIKHLTSEERHERHLIQMKHYREKLKQKNDNLEKELDRRRAPNLSEDQLERYRINKPVVNLNNERNENKRAKARIMNMTDEQIVQLRLRRCNKILTENQGSNITTTLQYTQPTTSSTTNIQDNGLENIQHPNEITGKTKITEKEHMKT